VSLLFNRDFSITVGPIKIAARPLDPLDKSKPTLRVVFSVEKTSSKDPNTAKLTIYNLNEAHRKILEQAFAGPSPKILPIIIEAGYVGNVSQLFKGDVTYSYSKKTGTTWETGIEAGDGARSYKTARMTKSYKGPVTMAAVVADVVKQFGLKPGNALTKIATNRRGLVLFKKGVAVNGRCSEILNRFLTSAGYQWSIQDEQLQVLEPGEASLIEGVVILNPSSGLIGTPELGQDGVLKAKSLLQGSIHPGKRVGIKSSTADGFFVVEKVTHSGDTWGSEWYTDLETKAPKEKKKK
jgi:hypothetical protein